jgi:endo-1,4-beta-xylanase
VGATSLVSISLTPLSAALTASEPQQFIATVGRSSNTAVTWTRSPAVGTISATGLYTAPAAIAAGQTVTVKATSVADPTKSAAATVTLLLPASTTLRQAGAERALLMGTAATADEFPSQPNPLDIPAYATILGEQYDMLSPENAMKWPAIHPAQNTYNFEPADQLVAFAQAHGMQIRGYNLCWYTSNPDWLTNLAKTSPAATMAQALKDHITTVVTRYRGRVFAWDVVNEAVSDWATGVGTDLVASIWYNQPGIGLTGTGYIEQAFRWAHAADPNALLFYNEYGIEAPGPKFQAVYNMLKDFVARGVPIHGVGLQMHIDTTGYPSTAGLTQSIQQLTALGLQVHITEMDVRLPVNGSGTAPAADLQAQAQTYQRILTVCLQNPRCTAFQTWEFSDKYSWIPYYFPGFGAALPFDANYRPKPAFNAMISALRTVPPTLKGTAILNAASHQGGAVAPGEFVIISEVNHGPSSLTGAQLDGDQPMPSNLAGTQVFFDGRAAPMLYAVAGQVGVMVPYEVAGKRETTVEYEYNGIRSDPATIAVMESAPGIFAEDKSGKGQGFIFNQDNSPNTAENPAAGGTVIQVLSTGGGTIAGGATDGALAHHRGSQTLPLTATIGGVQAAVVYAGPAPGRVNGILQVELAVPGGLNAGPQPVVITVGGRVSQGGVTVAVK